MEKRQLKRHISRVDDIELEVAEGHKGHNLVQADYAKLEVRVAAALAETHARHTSTSIHDRIIIGGVEMRSRMKSFQQDFDAQSMRTRLRTEVYLDKTNMQHLRDWITAGTVPMQLGEYSCIGCLVTYSMCEGGFSSHSTIDMEWELRDAIY